MFGYQLRDIQESHWGFVDLYPLSEEIALYVGNIFLWRSFLFSFYFCFKPQVEDNRWGVFAPDPFPRKYLKLDSHWF